MTPNDRLVWKRICGGAESAMKKNRIIIVNVLIMVALLTFVVLYSRYASRKTTERQIEHFENTTITMEHVRELSGG